LTLLDDRTILQNSLNQVAILPVALVGAEPTNTLPIPADYINLVKDARPVYQPKVRRGHKAVPQHWDNSPRKWTVFAHGISFLPLVFAKHRLHSILPLAYQR
jgi:hypothetical protein